MDYAIRKTEHTPDLDGRWDSPVWQQAETLEIAQFRPESSDHRPATQARLLYDARGIHVMFNVQDRYVRCVATKYQGDVCEDACVEFFAQPKPDQGYFNFETNCGGVLLLNYIEDPTRTADGFVKYTDVPWDIASRIRVYHSLTGPIDPEIKEAVEWRVQYVIPFDLFERYVGPLGDLPGQEWRGNFYKCAETNSHPHWAAWSPIDGALNFHRPDRFAPIRFEA